MARSRVLVWVAALLVCAVLVEAGNALKKEPRRHHAELDDYNSDPYTTPDGVVDEETGLVACGHSHCKPGWKCAKFYDSTVSYLCYDPCTPVALTFPRCYPFMEFNDSASHCGSDGRKYLCDAKFNRAQQCNPGLKSVDWEHCKSKSGSTTGRGSIYSDHEIWASNVSKGFLRPGMGLDDWRRTSTSRKPHL